MFSYVKIAEEEDIFSLRHWTLCKNFSVVLCVPIAFVSLALAVSGFGASSIAEEKELVVVENFVSRDGVHPGETFKVAVLLKITRNWHIHGHKLDDEFLVPTSLDFEASENLKILDYYYPPPKSGKFAYSDVALLVYEKEVILGALVEAKNDTSAGPLKIQGKLRYQACDDSSCRPPKTVVLEITVEVVALDRETRDAHPEIFSKMEFKKSPAL